jgi:hypothetical protein
MAMAKHDDPGQIGHDDPGQIGHDGSGRVPYTEPVLRALGALRELTFKSGEKATAHEKTAHEKHREKHVGQ